MSASEFSGPWPIDAFRVHDLRRRVLRPDLPPSASRYPADEERGTQHVAVLRGDEVVAAGSLFEEAGWRLRGMATDAELRGRGLGSRVLETLLETVARRGGGRVWCNARTSASGFYERHGFVRRGESFELEGIGEHVVLERSVASGLGAAEWTLADVIAVLPRTPRVLDAWFGGTPEVVARRVERGGVWSIRDVVGHLLHGEDTDWLPRIRHVLGPKRQEPFAPFERFAMERRFAQLDFDALLDAFGRARRESLAGLAELELDDERMALTGVHPVLGPVTVRELLHTWACHDLDHLAQAARIVASHLAGGVGPFAEFLAIARPRARDAR